MALRGVRVLEMSGLAPVPYCGQVLRDYGAEVIRVDRAGAKFNIDRQTRGKKSIALNMKSSAGQGILRKLATGSDVILDPFRPGVMERLNCGPKELLGTVQNMKHIITSFKESEVMLNQCVLNSGMRR